MMNCPTCKQAIESDSLYCDQCGAELKKCPNCGTLGKGNFCPKDRTKLVSLKDSAQAGGAIPAAPTPTPLPSAPTPPATPPSPSASAVYSSAAPPASPAQHAQAPTPDTTAPTLVLVNDNQKLRFQVYPGQIIGRKKGPFAKLLHAFTQISSTHAQVNYSPQQGWQILDLGSNRQGSTNGTKISTDGNWTQAQRLPAATAVSLANARYILFANVEFRIEQSPSSPPNDATIVL